MCPKNYALDFEICRVLFFVLFCFCLFWVVFFVFWGFFFCFCVCVCVGGGGGGGGGGDAAETDYTRAYCGYLRTVTGSTTLFA